MANKSMEDLANLDGVSDVPSPTEIGPNNDIPEYLYTDVEVVGYSDVELQKDIYNLSIGGVIPFTGQSTIVDIGCGRGDLYYHIKKSVPSLSLTYIGYEMNEMMAHVGNQIFKDRGDSNAIILNTDFLKAKIDPTANAEQVFLIGSLNINYGWDTEKWVYLEQLITKSLEVASGSVTLILLHDNGGNESYISYPIPNLTELVMKFNLPFKLEHGEITGVYKITLFI